MAFDRIRNGVTVTIQDSSKYSVDEFYFIWGQNCKNLDMTQEESRKAFSSCCNHAQVSATNFDDFWNGYHSIT